MKRKSPDTYEYFVIGSKSGGVHFLHSNFKIWEKTWNLTRGRFEAMKFDSLVAAAEYAKWVNKNHSWYFQCKVAEVAYNMNEMESCKKFISDIGVDYTTVDVDMDDFSKSFYLITKFQTGAAKHSKDTIDVLSDISYILKGSGLREMTPTQAIKEGENK